MKRFFYLLVMMLVSFAANAQTDMTDLITNPDFEDTRATNGWTREGSFGVQGNNDFPLKHGGHYMERWNGGNNPIGSGPRISQTISKLPLGVYTLKAVAQNINQGNSGARQTGAFLFVDNGTTTQTTEINLPNDYSVTIVVPDGTLTIGVYLEGCTGNYVCVDNFRLYVSEDADQLRPYCQRYIDQANAVNQHLSTSEQTELDAAVALVQRYASGELTDGMLDALTRLLNAIDAYEYSLASDSNPYEMTGKIENPSFESGAKGWTTDMGPQSNNEFPMKKGSMYLEKWQGDSGVRANASQIVNGVPAGHYTLKVAAQNILQSSSWSTQSGAYIYGESERTAVNSAADYSVNFTAIGGVAEIGFTANPATGNWLAIDNFRLYYRGKASLSEMKSILNKSVQEAQSLITKQMNSNLKTNLENALDQALSASTEDEVNAAAAALKPAVVTARPSVASYQALLDKINATQTELNGVSGSNGRDEAQAVIDAAWAVYNNGNATQEEMDEAAAALPNAVFICRVKNGSGTPPTVKTHPVVIYGCKAAVGRLTATGSNIIESGFCWSENPNPTVFDNHSSDYDEFNGRVYLMPNLKPSTQYYVRAYAMTGTYAVGYGDVVRIITGYESDIRWDPSTRFSWGDTTDERNQACINAFNTALDNLRVWTSIRGYSPYLNVEDRGGSNNTAECGYGGWIGAGFDAAKNPGTMLHENGHGIGVGQHWRYTSWDSPLHYTVYWSGERANRVFAFFENQPDVFDENGEFAYGGNHTVADGDRVHVCYGLSWVTSRIDLLRQAAFYQGMYEDGMPATNDGCCPFYSLESVDTLKYYITNEENGMMTKYLKGDGSRPTYRLASLDEVLTDDSFAWQVHYDAYSGFYQLKNVATGKYMSYTSNFVMRDVANLTPAEDIHLMPCRYMTKIKVGTEEVEIKPYWMGRGNRDIEPEVLAVSSATSSTLKAPKLDFWDSSTTQHWAILSSEQLQNISEIENQFCADRLRQLVAGSKELVATDHTENGTSVDADFQVKIAEAEALCETIDNATDYVAAVRDFTKDITTFLTQVEPLDVAHPLNITFLLDDPDLESGSSWNGDLDLSRSSTQYTAKNFSFTQTTPTLPKGVYRLRAHGFQRPGVLRTAFNEYLNGTNNVTATYTVNNQNKKLCHIAEGAVEERFNEGGTESRVSTFFMPSNVAGAHVYMQHGLYHNDIVYGLTAPTAFKITVSDADAKADYWTVVDGFTIDFYGTKITRTDVTGVPEVEAGAEQASEVEGYYTLSGMKVSQPVENGITIVKYTDGHTTKIYK